MGGAVPGDDSHSRPERVEPVRAPALQAVEGRGFEVPLRADAPLHGFVSGYLCGVRGRQRTRSRLHKSRGAPRSTGGRQRLAVRSLGSLMLLVHTHTQRFVLFYEDNILTDSLNPQTTWPVEPGSAISLAIRNALFTITPVNSLFLFATLLDDEMVDKGSLFLGMGLYGLLPTLPDPYAANVALLRRQGRLEQRTRHATLLLVANVAWTKAATDEDPDQVVTSFAFA